MSANPAKRLLYQIRKGHFRIQEDYFEDGSEFLMRKLIVQTARAAFCVDCQNVAEWHFSTENKSPDASALCPIAKLPFPNMWFEYDFPANPYGVAEEGPSEELRCGILANQSDETNEITTMLFSESAYVHTHLSGHIMFKINQDFEIDDETSSVYSIDPETTVGGESYQRAKEHMSGFVFQGNCPVLASIAFFHCKNVTIKTIRHSAKQEKNFLKKHSEPLESFSVIEIHKNMVRGRAEYDDAETTRHTRAHIVRGHFKKYGPENKLMGRHEGMWFWNPQMRGQGTPLKHDYRTWPPSPKHARKCLVKI